MDHELEILPTGELYVPHQHVRVRLNAALGPGNWWEVELGDPIQNDREIIWRWRLEFCTGWGNTAVGHAMYNKQNPRGSYGDALETCKSDALVRNMKGLGFGTVLLNREWKEKWKLANCRLVWRREEMKLRWRRNDALPFEDEGMPDRDPGPQYQRKLDYYDQAREHWADLTEKRPDAARMERAEKEEWTHAGAAPWDEWDEAARVAAEDALFADDGRED